MAEEAQASSLSPSASPNRPTTPHSPQLRPREHRQLAETSSSEEDLFPRRTQASRSPSGDTASGSNSSSRANSVSSVSPSGPNALTDSVVSVLDLNDDQGRGQTSLSSTRSRQEGSRVPPRLPLVREDTATRQAIEAMDDPSSSSTPEPFSASIQPSASDHSASHSSSSSSTSIVTPSTILSPTGDRQRRHHEDGDDDDEDDDEDEPAPHQPKTTRSHGDHAPETVPTVSATGMPRFFPRSTDDPKRQQPHPDEAPPPPELMPEGTRPEFRRSQSRGRRRRSSSSRSSSADSDFIAEDDEGGNGFSDRPLLMQAFTPSSKLSVLRRVSIVSSSFFINLGLPFINGLFLGFGEIFARSLIAPLVLGLVEHQWPHLGRWRWEGGGNRPNGASTGSHHHRHQHHHHGGEDITAQEKARLAQDAGSGQGIGTSGVGVRATRY